MRIATATSRSLDPKSALAELSVQLAAKTTEQARPSFVAVFGAARVVGEPMVDSLRTAFGRLPVHGGSSYGGVIADCWNGGSLPRVGALAIYDHEGQYGTASASIGDDPAKAAQATTRRAIARTNRVGEAPELVILTCAPGHENEILAGVQREVGAGTPIVGVTSSDEERLGVRAQFSDDGQHRDGLTVSVLFPSRPVCVGAGNHCAPSAQSGIITSAERRRIMTIDGIPAADMYRRWHRRSALQLVVKSNCGDDAAPTFLMPFGRCDEGMDTTGPIRVIQPDQLNEDGSISVFSDVAEGERLWSMVLEFRDAQERTRRILEQIGSPAEDPAGSLVISSAVGVQAQRQHLDQLANGIHEGVGSMPYLALFGMGEQFVDEDGSGAHSYHNLVRATFG